MRGREFLELARELSPGTMPRHWRAIAIHAYYALFLECREAMARWGIPPPARQDVHATVRLRLSYSSDPELKKIGTALEVLVWRRNRASYDLAPLPLFSSPAGAQFVIQVASDALARLDAIDADPARRAAAIASIRP